MVKTYTYPCAIVHITIPDRTPEQQEAWEKRLRKATADFGRAVLKDRAKGCAK